MVHALIHTKGVVLGTTYIPLELVFVDILGHQNHFHIRSPLNYSKMRKLYPHSRPDVLVTRTSGTPYSDVLQFLRSRFQSLQQFFPDPVFGYKGNSYQPKVLEDANISNRVNIEKIESWKLTLFRIMDHEPCPLHKGDQSKCAWTVMEKYLLAP